MVALSSSSGASTVVPDDIRPAPQRTSMSPSRRRRRASPEWEGREIITVATLPGRGLYARHLGHPEGVDGVHRSTIPPPGAVARHPAHFEPGWVTAKASDFDIVHVLGVPPMLSPEEVSRAADCVKEAGRPLVATAYHLSDPTGADEAHYAAQLDALLPKADAVVTLTDSAAQEICRRWGLDPLVVPHPHAVDFVRMRRGRPRYHRGTFVIGTHLGSLRVPGDPVDFIGVLASVVRDIEDVRLVVHVHDHLLDPDSSRYAPSTIAEIERVVSAGGGTVRAHRPMTDAQLWDHLFSLDASVVPPLAGSHSVWPEACYDLGTLTLIQGDSHAARQRPCLSYRLGPGTAPNAESLHKAVTAAKTLGAAWRADPAERWKERVTIAESLRGLYERLLAKR